MSQPDARLRLWTVARRSLRLRRAHEQTDRCDPTAQTVVVDAIDDPDEPFRLVRAAGSLTATSIDRLFDAWATLLPPHAIHLDLSDAHIADAGTMQRLESALDHLERQQISVRLVGIDPHHPVLRR